ncbi:MAG: hypothetical protein ACE5FC_03125 [Myxococcota bacterium]
MGPSLKTLQSQTLGASLALAVLALAASPTGSLAGALGAGLLLPDPGQACLLPAGGGVSLVALALLVSPAAAFPEQDHDGPGVRAIARKMAPGIAFVSRAIPLRPAMAHPKRAGLSCGLPLGAHAPPPTA